MKIDLLIIVLFVVYCFPLPAQSISIHAESVGEWQTTQALSPEYRFNSVSVFLLNEDKLFKLFDPNNLSKDERKKTGIKTFDTIESLYFHLELPNPKKGGDILSFPLYAFDLKPSSDFKSTKSQGKILDRITDEELNGKAMEAVARIETVNKNDFLEIAYKISSNINKLLAGRIFKKPDIWEVMQKAQQYFEDKYRSKIVAEFNVPILPSSQEYEYIIQSASLYQIKWNFQPSIETYRDNVWSDLSTVSTITEDDLRDKPTRLSKLRNQPYLMVVRYKSAYALPKEQQLNVDISDAYLEKRMYNLQEFPKETIQYRAEDQFVGLLREAIELKKNVEAYQYAKGKGNAQEAALLKIVQQYYNILSAHQQVKTALSETELGYYQECYEVSYFKFFKQIDQFLFADQQIKKISEAATELMILPGIVKDSLDSQALYAYLEKLQTYRHLASTVEQPRGNLFYKIKEQIAQIESALFNKILTSLPYTREEKIERLEAIKGQYALCAYCIEQANLKKIALQEAITAEIRTALLGLQNQHLEYGRCFSNIQEAAKLELEKEYPSLDTLEFFPDALYEAFFEKIKGLEDIAKSFLTISTIKVQDLSAEALETNINQYKGLIATYRQQACQLHYGGLLPKKDFECLGEVCKKEIP